MSFVVLLLAYNIVVFGINITGAVERFHWILGFFQTPRASPILVYQKASLGLEIAFVPTFLWISDAFLVSLPRYVIPSRRSLMLPVVACIYSLDRQKMGFDPTVPGISRLNR
jgi:hypothetical protein